MGNGGRAVLDPSPVANIPEGTTSQAGSEAAVSTGDARSRSDMVIADDVASYFDRCQSKWWYSR